MEIVLIFSVFIFSNTWACFILEKKFFSYCLYLGLVISQVIWQLKKYGPLL